MRDPRVVAITGASAGIGRATALRLARDRATLGLCARRADKLQDTAAAVDAAGGRALPVVADVTSDTDMRAFVERIVSDTGRLDVMICNAGFGIAGTIEQVTSDQMRRLLETNVLGTYHAARAAASVFRRQGHGHLILISSIVGRRGVPYMGAYASTKFAQVGLAECMREELAGSRIHVSVVFPVSTDTEFYSVMTRETGAEVERAFGPRQQVESVAEAIARTIERPAAEVYPHRASRALVWLNAFAPAFCDRVVKKFGRRRIGP